MREIADQTKRIDLEAVKSTLKQLREQGVLSERDAMLTLRLTQRIEHAQRLLVGDQQDRWIRSALQPVEKTTDARRIIAQRFTADTGVETADVATPEAPPAATTTSPTTPSWAA